MAKIRSIKPDFFASEQLAICSRDARLLFIGCLIFADDRGVHPASYLRLKMEIFPSDACDISDIAKWMDELKKVGLMTEFELENKVYWHITGFTKHQQISRPYYKFPAPPEFKHGYNQPESNSDTVQAVFEHSSSSYGNGNVNGDCNDKEINTSQVADATSVSSDIKPPNEFTKKIIIDVESIFQYWQQVLNHPQAKLDKRRIAKIQQALKLGFTVEQLKQAIEGCAKTPFNMGQNDRNQKYDGIDLIFRDAEHIERFIQAASLECTASSKQSSELFAGVW